MCSTRYMKKAEAYHLPNPQQVILGATVIPGVHGFRGNVNAGFPQPYEGTVATQNIETALRTAVSSLVKNPDLASGTVNGVARFQYSIKPGNNNVVTPGGNLRSSSANAYIYPSLRVKSNLVILTGHQATAIVWGKRDSSLSRASGVKFIQTPAINSIPGRVFDVTVAREVIVASGAIGSPRFLELSGVGDPRILNAAGITVEESSLIYFSVWGWLKYIIQVDLPAVGTNLQDQALNINIFAVPPNRPVSEYTILNAPLSSTVAFLDVEQVLGADAARVAGSDLLQSVSKRAKDIVSSGAFTSESGLIKILSNQATSIVDHKDPVMELSYMMAQPSFANGAPVIGTAYWNLIPQWRGTVHIKSNNPSVQPEGMYLDPRFYTVSDFDLVLKGNATRIARDIFNTSPLGDYVGEELVPGNASLPENATNAEVQAYVVSTFQPTLHPIGSVPMLPRQDGGAVSPDLVVYGTVNVRVVDSSIIPIQLSAHLSSTVYGIAEKAADMIQSKI
ncbi:hypothetical protein DXG01_001535 [Tephrocybe rancida]|nr:hypothetical protein DXG01_001535 [Tephrocybe rancida]